MKGWVYTPQDRFSAAVDMTRCRASVHDGRGFHSHQCNHKATVTDADGIGWCKQHDPVEMTRRDEERSKKYDAKWAREQRQRERPQRLEALLERALVSLDAMGGELGAHPLSLHSEVIRGEIREELGHDG